MREKILTTVLIFLLAIIQLSFLANLFPRHIAPNILLALIVIWSAKKGFRETWPWALVAGFFLDILSLGAVGFNMVAFFLVALQTDYLAKRFLVAYKTIGFFMLMVFVVLGTVVSEIMAVLFFQATSLLAGQGMLNLFEIFKVTNLFLQLLGNIIIFAVVYWLVTKRENVFQRRLGKPIVQ